MYEAGERIRRYSVSVSVYNVRGSGESVRAPRATEYGGRIAAGGLGRIWRRKLEEIDAALGLVRTSGQA